ncbi:unnamed protein product [Urochloa humidicola]
MGRGGGAQRHEQQFFIAAAPSILASEGRSAEALDVLRRRNGARGHAAAIALWLHGLLTGSYGAVDAPKTVTSVSRRLLP